MTGAAELAGMAAALNIPACLVMATDPAERAFTEMVVAAAARYARRRDQNLAVMIVNAFVEQVLDG